MPNSRPRPGSILNVRRWVKSQRLLTKVEGATLRDTRNQCSFRPYLGNKLTAWFTVGHLDKAEIVIAVESPIDALSYRTIHACRGDAWAVVSCAGATVPDQLMRLAYKRRQRFVVALDNDRAGERGWRKTWDETDRSLPTLCGQTRVRWIHEHGSSETIGGSFLEPNARRRGFPKACQRGGAAHLPHSRNSSALRFC